MRAKFESHFAFEPPLVLQKNTVTSGIQDSLSLLCTYYSGREIKTPEVAPGSLGYHVWPSWAIKAFKVLFSMNEEAILDDLNPSFIHSFS